MLWLDVEADPLPVAVGVGVGCVERLGCGFRCGDGEAVGSIVLEAELGEGATLLDLGAWPPPERWCDAGGLDDGSGDGDGVQTSSIPSVGGASCVAGVSPIPHTQPSRSPSPMRADPAPVDAHVQPPDPSPCQYPQKSG
jgi:hypothetical protein